MGSEESESKMNVLGRLSGKCSRKLKLLFPSDDYFFVSRVIQLTCRKSLITA